MNPGYVVLGVLFILLIYMLFKGFGFEVVEEPISEEAAERIVNARANILNNICDTVGDAWGVLRDDLNVNMELIPHENTLVTMIYKNNLLRIYVYWKEKRVQINLTKRLDANKSKVYKKSFGLYRKSMLENVYSYLEKYKPEQEESISSEGIAAAKEVIVEKLTQIIEDIIDEKVEEKLTKMLEQLDKEERDHE